MPSNKIPVDQIFAEAVTLLNGYKTIITESMLFNSLGVSKDWFYASLMKVPEYSDRIKKLLRLNKSAEARSALEAAQISTHPACIIARMKICDADMKEALSDRVEEKTQDRDIIINIPGELIDAAKEKSGEKSD